MTLNGVMAVTLRYFTEFSKHTFQHMRRSVAEFMHESIVFCKYVYDVVVKKVHVRYLISWWVSCVSLLVYKDRVKSSLTEQCLKCCRLKIIYLLMESNGWNHSVCQKLLTSIRHIYICAWYTRAEGSHQFCEYGKTRWGKTVGFLPRNFHRDGNKHLPQNQTLTMNMFGRRCNICGSRYHRLSTRSLRRESAWSSKPANVTTVIYNSLGMAAHFRQADNQHRRRCLVIA